MPTGTHLTKREKEQIHDYFCNHSFPVDKAHQDLFQGDTNKISIRTLQDHKIMLKSASYEEIIAWIAGKPRTGNKRSELDEPGVCSILNVIACKRPKLVQDDVAEKLSNAIGDNRTWSQSSISRWLRRHDISNHRISFISALLNEEERAQTLLLAAPYETHHMHNTDESSAARDKFIAKIARSHKGEIPMENEWFITGTDGRVYSVIADYSTEGWTCWRIFLCNINHLCVEQFFREDLSRVLGHGDVLMHDGASIHLVDSTQQLLDEITHGRHIKVAAYSHDLSPVERGFANTWAYIRRHYDPSIHRPIDIINEAFAIYSVTGPLGYKARNHWGLYERNHQF